MSLNSWTFAGRLGRDPESRSAGSGTVCNFSVAVDQKKRDAPPIWVRVAAWGKLGEVCQQYLSKGRKVSVCGEVATREYNGKTQIEVTARQVEFGEQASKPKQDGSGYYAPPTGGKTSGPFSPEDEEIPF